MAYPPELYPDPEGFNPATERFRVGQFVRVNDPKSTVNGCAARIISVSNGWRVAEHALGTGLFDASSLEPWTPCPGERVRIARCDEYPQHVGKFGEYRIRGGQNGEGDHWVWLDGVRFCSVLRRDTEFEPVFEEAEKQKLDEAIDQAAATAGVSRDHVRACVDDLRAKLPRASFNGIEFPTDEGRSPRAFADALRERLLDHLEETATAERTHCDRKPRAEREAERKRMVMEVLSGEWKGKR